MSIIGFGQDLSFDLSRNKTVRDLLERIEFPKELHREFRYREINEEEVKSQISAVMTQYIFHTLNQLYETNDLLVEEIDVEVNNLTHDKFGRIESFSLYVNPTKIGKDYSKIKRILEGMGVNEQRN